MLTYAKFYNKPNREKNIVTVSNEISLILVTRFLSS